MSLSIVVNTHKSVVEHVYSSGGKTHKLR